MGQLVLVRHGQSLWNQANRFTGWVDVDLSENGILEAQKAGAELKAKEIVFDTAFTSCLKRAIRTYDLIVNEMDQGELMATAHWQLNERHYGALQGLNKSQTQEKYGKEQVQIWRRSYNIPPPLAPDNELISDSAWLSEVPNPPLGESLEDTANRVLPFFAKKILPLAKAGKNVLVVAHGNSLRALVMSLEKLSPEQIVSREIPTAQPIIYSF